MTSEVVLMNRQAVAMAADSAVTITGPQYLKTYQSVDKLFPLVDGQPVAVMIYNNAEIMSTPWETVISLYREATKGRSLDSLEAYSEDFMAFISGNPDLFPPDHQDTEFFKHVAVVFTVIAEDFDYQISRFQETHAARLKDNARAELACFPKGMGEQVKRRYRAEIEQLIDSLLAALKSNQPNLTMSEATRERLREIAVFAVIKDAFFEHYTGVVFAGFGARDKFPAMRSYLTSSVVLGILKRKQDRRADMTSEGGPVVQPFAQDRMIKTFLTGMDEYLRRFMYGESLKLSLHLVTDVIGRAPGLSETQRQQLFRDYSENNLGYALREFFKAIDSYQYAMHTGPIYRAIGSLPKRELGETAASLIKLNSFQQKVMHSIETVGGPIDVAVITRNGGLELKSDKADF